MDLKQLFEKYRAFIAYAVFGVFTTVVNIAAYWVCAHTLGLGTMPSTVIAWILAVFFAYVTNRKWVFDSQAEGAAEIAKECLAFFAARLATGALDWGCMWLFVDVLHVDDMIVKIGANVLVIILNFVLSKLVVFRKK